MPTFIGAIVLAAILSIVRPRLPSLVGRLVWPPLILMRRRGKAGLFLSWCLYFGTYVIAVLLFVQLLRWAGFPIAWGPDEKLLVTGLLVAQALLNTVLDRNPSRDLDEWILGARALISELGRRDLEDQEILGTWSPEEMRSVRECQASEPYLSHLRRIAAAVPAAAPQSGYAWSFALEWLADEIHTIQNQLDSQSSRAA